MSDTAYSGVGAQLRERRLRSGGDLPHISRVLRIRLAYLKAIEDGAFDQLPGTTYANGFVRSYANHLGFDGEAAVAMFRAEAAASPEDARLVFPAPMTEPKVPTGRILLVSVVLAAAIYGAWYHFNRATPLDDLVPPVADSLQTEGDQSASPGADVNADAPAEAPASGGETAAAPAPGPADGQSAAGSSPSPNPGPTPAAPAASGPDSSATPASPAAEATPPALPGDTEGSVYGDKSGSARISLKALAETWVQIREASGTPIFTRTLKTGDVYNVPSRDDLILFTGNAGGVEITVDGKKAGVVGQSGQVRRDVPLVAKKLLEDAPR